jgi:hypothetical protein
LLTYIDDKGAVDLNFTYHEVEGDKPISKWIVVKVADFVRSKYGLDIKVKLNDKYILSLNNDYLVNDKPV